MVHRDAPGGPSCLLSIDGWISGAGLYFALGLRFAFPRL
jgi:hypothetical protein